MRDEISLEGEYMRRFYSLELLCDRTPRFTLSWTIIHPINEYSPFCQSLHAPYSYSANDILWSHRFEDIIQQTPEGHQYIDYTHFHHAHPVNN